MKSLSISFPLSSAWARLKEIPVSTSQNTSNLTTSNLNTSNKDGFVFVSDPDGDAAHRYSEMIEEILARLWPRQLMLVTSPTSGDGKTLTSVNLALALAAKGLSVLLVELTLTRPRYRYAFGAGPSHRGVESVLTGESNPEDVTFRLGETNVGVASVANPMPTDSLLDRSENMERLLEYGRSTFDWTILEVPPIDESGAIKKLAADAGPVVMVARSYKTKLHHFRQAAAALGRDLDYVILNDLAS